MNRILTLASTVALLTLLGPAAWACGGLISPSGTVQLQRTTTLVAYDAGVEHYVTSFDFAGGDSSFGSIVPLPDVPTVVERGGDWTLQRALIEVGQFLPPPPSAQNALESADTAEVLLETQVDALDVTILRGGADEVIQWAREEGFQLSPDTSDVLRFYADRSPIFMAARFDASRAADGGFIEGDGIPIHLAIPTDDPWVPLHILALGKQAAEVVEADVFLLTPAEPGVRTGGGVRTNRSEPADRSFLADLRSDRSSEWVPQDAWFTHLVVETPAGGLRYDIAIDAFGGQPSEVDAGFVTTSTVQVSGGPAPFPDAPLARQPGSSGESAGSGDGPGSVVLILVSALGGAALLAGGILIGQRTG